MSSGPDSHATMAPVSAGADRGWLHVTVCGEVSLARADGDPRPVRGRQPQVVVAHLAVTGGRVHREQLADALWGEHVSDHWPGALRGVLSKVRAALVEVGLPPTSLRSEGAVVWLDVPAGVRTDLGDASAAVQAASEASAAGDHDEVLRTIGPARVTLARPFLLHNDSHWSRVQRDEIDALAARAMHQQVTALLATGQSATGVSVARAAVAERPLDEVAHHLLIEVLLADGQRARAVQALSELTELLAVELGIAPAEATVALLRPVERAAEDTRSRSARPADDTPFVGR